MEKKGTGSKAKTVGEEEGFIALLRVACDDRAINATLEKLLALPDDRRKALVILAVETGRVPLHNAGAFEDGTRILDRTWDVTIPRDNV